MISQIRSSIYKSYLLIQQQGFPRNMTWLIIDSDNIEGDPVLTLEMTDDPYNHTMWIIVFSYLSFLQKIGFFYHVLEITIFSAVRLGSDRCNEDQVTAVLYL